ncbi:rRNA maturation RNase YbeY [Desulfofalx alkaliphila]|uniref:rRNA maturation RNase YbeY n=1 Tax=Desulfofalx alkaliphila TaxID=105483 RepID=UPI0004E0BAB6|nr:rRNA maturation RNase YbeY [Desulfofalx alkaliphila]
MAVLVSKYPENVQVQQDWGELVEKVVNKALALHQSSGSEVSVVFVNDQYIQQLNSRYREVDKPTDVLSFAMDEGEEMPMIEGVAHVLGDIFISVDTALRQAKEYNHSPEREIAFLAIHGTLHLLGYSHQGEEDTKKMREQEEAVLAELGLFHTRPNL